MSDEWAEAGKRHDTDDGGHWHEPSYPSCVVCRMRDLEAERERLLGVVFSSDPAPWQQEAQDRAEKAEARVTALLIETRRLLERAKKAERERDAATQLLAQKTYERVAARIADRALSPTQTDPAHIGYENGCHCHRCCVRDNTPARPTQETDPE